jgi:hypothetical protein
VIAERRFEGPGVVGSDERLHRLADVHEEGQRLARTAGSKLAQ